MQNGHPRYKQIEKTNERIIYNGTAIKIYLVKSELGRK